MWHHVPGSTRPSLAPCVPQTPTACVSCSHARIAPLIPQPKPFAMDPTCYHSKQGAQGALKHPAIITTSRLIHDHLCQCHNRHCFPVARSRCGSAPTAWRWVQTPFAHQQVFMTAACTQSAGLQMGGGPLNLGPNPSAKVANGCPSTLLFQRILAYVARGLNTKQTPHSAPPRMSTTAAYCLL